MMANVISITTLQRNGEYADVIRFVDHMAKTFGSSANATAVLLRGSPEYRLWRSKQRRRKRKAS